MSDEIVRLKLEKLKLLEAEIELRRALPHLYSQKHYPWSHEFENDWDNKIQVLCAANQLGKSTSLIKKLIRVATEPETWHTIWPDLKHTNQKPTTFWYLYPSKDIATMEFDEKWRPLLPQVPKDDPQYGWDIDMRLKYISTLSFNTGVNVYFKTYAQDPSLLQAGTVYFLACFVAGTKVLTPSGEVPIETIATQNFVETRAGAQQVVRAFSREAFVVDVALSNGRTLTGTLDHPVWTQNRGWVALADLDFMDILLGSDLQHYRILAPANREKQRSETVYCLKVDRQPEYFANGVLVHNCDEEVPAELLPELQTRTNATNGYMHFVFTATSGQQFWKEVVEDKTRWTEAKVRQVSLFDSQFYIDGSPSRWTNERIEQAVSRCVSKAEVDRRIYGRFVVDAGRLFPNWDRETHLKSWHHVPKDWMLYCGIDHGSGGETNHPAAITFVAVSPEMDKARVVKHWRGDRIQTTAQDVINKFLEMTTGMGMPQTVYYDYSAKDLGLLAVGMGLPFEKANKSANHGTSMVNLLLKQNALIVYKYVPDCPFAEDHMQGHKLAEEMEMLHEKTDKRHAKDDSTDSLRYAISSLSFNYELITGFNSDKKATVEILSPAEERMRKMEYKEEDLDNQTVDEEIEFWADLVE